MYDELLKKTLGCYTRYAEKVDAAKELCGWESMADYKLKWYSDEQELKDLICKLSISKPHMQLMQDFIVKYKLKNKIINPIILDYSDLNYIDKLSQNMKNLEAWVA